MFRITSLFLIVGTIVVVSAYPPGYVPQRCQDDDGSLLPSATDCEDESDLCPALFGNITTDVRAKACNSEIDVVKEGVMMCAKTCKVCCEKPEPPTPEPVTPHPYPLRCQDENGVLLPSATDCEDESDLCPTLFGNITTDVRANICNGEIDAVKEGVMMCAKTCKVCCEKPEPPAGESTTTDAWGNTEAPPLRCQNANGTLLPSATDCEDESPECSEIFFESDPTVVRPYRCNDEFFDNYTLSCARTCKVCCEKPKPSTPEPVTPNPYPKCQDENGVLLPSATDCEDMYTPQCPNLFGNITTDVRDPYCNELFDKNDTMTVFACAKSCKLCCERPPNYEMVDPAPEPEPTDEYYWETPPPEPQRCQDENGSLLPSAYDCEDGFIDCGILYYPHDSFFMGLYRSTLCNDKNYSPDGDLRCAKTCNVCCERKNVTLPALDYKPDKELNDRVDLDLLLELGKKPVDIKPHCQYSNGTFMESARNCKDRYLEPCQDLFGIPFGDHRSELCYTKDLRYFALIWCPQTCGMCCELSPILKRT